MNRQPHDDLTHRTAQRVAVSVVVRVVSVVMHAPSRTG